MKKPKSSKSYIDKNGEALELDDQWFAEATYHPGHKVPKELISLRLDADIVAHFKNGGAGYQTRINHVLAAFVRRVRRGARA